jgi:alpha-methylacyl-CoA racemase
MFEGKDACIAPVLSLGEAPEHPHNRQRGTFIDVGGVTQPSPAPRLQGTPAPTPRPPRKEGADGDTILSELGVSEKEIENLRQRRVLL